MIFGIGTTDPVREQQLRGAYGEWATPPDPDVGFFTGAVTSPFQGIGHAMSIGASAAAEAAVPILETVTPDSIDVWLRDKRRSAYEWMSNSRADPKTMGILAQAGHAVGNVGTLGLAGGLMGGLPGAAGMVAAGTGYDKYREVLDQTGDVAVSAKVAGTTALVMGAGVMLPPYMGATIAKQIASGVAVNVGLGVTERGVSGAFLEDKYPEVAQHYKAFDTVSMMIDGILGGFVPVGAKLLKLEGAPTIADTDTAMTGRAGIAEQTRDPVVQTTLDGIDRQRAAANEVTRQIIEEGRSPADIEVPAGVMDNVVENPEFKQTVTRTVKAVNDFFAEEGYKPLRDTDVEIQNLARAFSEGADEVMVKQVVEGEPKAKPEPEVAARATEEPDPDQFTQVPAKNIAENRPDMEVEDADGNVTTAKDLIAKADEEFKKSQQESQLYKVAVACAIGVGE